MYGNKKCDVVNIDQIRNNFEAWMYEGEFTSDGIVFDVGSTTHNAIREGRGMCGERDNGNGSLMRIIPLALTNSDDDVIKKFLQLITHMIFQKMHV